MPTIERLSTGIPSFDKLIQGGIPKGFFVAVCGEPGTGKTIFSMHFISQGIREGTPCIFVTTEESKESIIRQASQFNMPFKEAVEDGSLIIIDALMGAKEDKWSIHSLELTELLKKIVEAKKKLGYGDARLVIDSMSAFWLAAPAMARRDSYYVKKVLTKWNFTTIATSQYAITTGLGFGFGIEHVADGIIRFRKSIREGVLKRFVMVEKMRQTQHDLKMYEIDIRDGIGLIIIRPTKYRREDLILPQKVVEKMLETALKKELEIPEGSG